MSGCCAPSAGDGAERPRDDRFVTAGADVGARAGSGTGADLARPGLARLDGGTFAMGTVAGEGYPSDGESPVHDVVLSPFLVSPVAVTNDDFAAFVTATGHRTPAETDGWSFVFGGLLPDDFPPTRAVAAAPWWRQVEGADWQHPEGPQSSIEGRGDHPVVHVAWSDAAAYCAWSGTRLPTEAEWEHAARGGLEGRRFPWGDDLEPSGEHRMNVFQGTFPSTNTAADGYLGTCPVDAFAPNGFGLHNMTGNVWEWCADWFAPDTYTATNLDSNAAGPRQDPTGPRFGTHRVMRGGSYLCHASYCTRYRVGARSANTPDSTAGNIGFRVAADANGRRGHERQGRIGRLPGPQLVGG